MNVVVYVSDALRTGPPRLLRRPIREHDRRSTSSRQAASASTQAISAAPWTAPSTTSIVTGHLRAPSRLPALGRAARSRRSRRCSARSPRTATRSRASSSTRTTSSGSSRGERPRHERDASTARSSGCARTATQPFLSLRSQLGDPHALRRSSTPTARTGSRRSRRSSTASSPTPRRRSRPCARATGRRSSASPRCSSRRSSRSSTALGLREQHGRRVPLRPRRVVGRAVRDEGGREGRLPHARRDALRRDRRGAADPLGAGTARAGRRRLAGALGRSHADAARPRADCPRARPTGSRCCRSRSTATGTAIIAGTDMGALTKLAVRMPPWKLILDVESGAEEAYQPRARPARARSRPADAPPELREIVFRELEAPSATSSRRRRRRPSRSGSPTSATS